MPQPYEVRVKDKLWKKTFECLPSHIQKIVNDKILNNIKFDPYKSEYLRLELEGLRSYKIKSGIRIIFAICEECRRNGFKKVNNCPDCEEIPDKNVMLFACGGHDMYNNLKWKRKNVLKK